MRTSLSRTWNINELEDFGFLDILLSSKIKVFTDEWNRSEIYRMEELSFLLWCTQGVEEVIPPHGTMRTVPSAGARHALETFLLVNRVK